MSIRERLSGNEAIAYAMRQIDPDVFAAFPITPSTEIPQYFAQYVANGEVNTEFVPVESEHSSMSACIGAEAAAVTLADRLRHAFLPALTLSITGVADSKTQQVLYSASAVSASGSSGAISYRLLYWGCRGDTVKALEKNGMETYDIPAFLRRQAD